MSLDKSSSTLGKVSSLIFLIRSLKSGFFPMAAVNHADLTQVADVCRQIIPDEERMAATLIDAIPQETAATYSRKRTLTPNKHAA
jgi:hypothetical protein